MTQERGRKTGVGLPAAWLDEIRWDEHGLVPAIAQDANTGRVLMVAWMNREALQETVQTGRGVYFSRSRGRLWRKGEESGNWQQVLEVRTDCDGDVILLQIAQRGGVACHTGRESCFYRRLAVAGGGSADPAFPDGVAASARAVSGAPVGGLAAASGAPGSAAGTAPVSVVWQDIDPVLKDPAQMYGVRQGVS